jgi:spore germination protein YaaH
VTPSPSGSSVPAIVPEPGHELYGYLPYWEMDDASIVDHVAATPLSTLALFSVTHDGDGTLRATKGFNAITGDIGRQLVEDAHVRGSRVELVYTSFGAGRNRRLLERPELRAGVIASLVELVGELDLDGVNVDVEALDPTLVPAYGQFLVDVRAAVVAADPDDQVSVATGAHALGAGMAAAATAAGVDRIFLMGYDYRTGRSRPGATSPLDREGGETPTLRSSLDLYAALGVPADRLLLGLPLYGVEWPVAGPVVGAPSTGRGQAWFPRSHVDLLTDPEAVPVTDEIEQVEVYLLGSDGSVGAPSIDPGGEADTRTWRAVYVDSPETLATKLALANERGLAGSGFWAIGYERGIEGYTRLMERFAGGEPLS